MRKMIPCAGFLLFILLMTHGESAVRSRADSLIQSNTTTNETIQLFAYDCSPTANTVELDEIDLNKVEECDKPYNTTAKDVVVQVLQKVNFRHARVISCAVTRVRHIFYCGTASHSSPISNDETLIMVTYEECQKMHQNREYVVGGRVLSPVHRNATSFFHSNPSVGTVALDGACTRGPLYEENRMVIEGVAALSRYKITLRDYTATVQEDTGTIHLHSGLTARYAEGQANDMFAGQCFWDVNPRDDHSCLAGDESHVILYEGNATIVSGNHTSEQQHAYLVVDAPDTTFAIQLVTEFLWCSHQGFESEHVGVRVMVKSPHLTWIFAKTAKSYVRADLMSFFQSKLQFLEVTSRQNLEEAVAYGIQKRCEHDIDVKLGNYALLRNHPEMTGLLLYSGKRGIDARVKGDVLYVVQCQFVETSFRETEACYHGIPVTYGNKSLFIQPETHILSEAADELPCSELAPAKFDMEDGKGSWLKLLPQPVITRDGPRTLKPMQEMMLHFTLKQVSAGGLWTTKDMRDLQRSMEFPAQRSAVDAYLANRVQGTQTESTYDGIRFFTEKDVKELSYATFKRLWGVWTDIGIAVAGGWGICFFCSMAKYIFSVAIRALHLHKELGWGFWIIGAVWSAITNYILSEAAPRMFNFGSKPEEPTAPHTDEEPKEENQKKRDRLAPIYPSLRSLTCETLDEDGNMKSHVRKY